MKTQLCLLFAGMLLITIYACQKEKIDPVSGTYYAEDEQVIINEYLNLPIEAIDYTIHYPDYYSTPTRATNNGTDKRFSDPFK